MEIINSFSANNMKFCTSFVGYTALSLGITLTGLSVSERAVGAADSTIRIQREQPIQSGDLEASYELGRALLRGEGVPRDHREALKLLGDAARAGHPGAMGAYGYMVAKGLASTADPVEGLSWIRKAADLGVSSAVLNAGIMTMKGQGTEADPAAGLAMVRKVAETGYMDAVIRLAELYYFGGDGIASDPEKAAPWARQAADAGNAWARNLVGIMKENVIGMPLDLPGAARYYGMAAAQGNSKAQSALGRLLFNGMGMPSDRVRAYYWLKAAAGQGEITARQFLAEVGPAFTDSETEAATALLKAEPPVVAVPVKNPGPGSPVPRLEAGGKTTP